MFDLRQRNLRDWMRRFHSSHRESDTTLGVAMALIAMLFIAGIVTAFIHAADTSKMQSAQVPTGPASTETTGSGHAGK
jgi:hypothetical protein